MSILSELGKLLGTKFGTLYNELHEKTKKLESLEAEGSILKLEIEFLKENKPSLPNLTSDLRLLDESTGVIFSTEGGNKYRIRIDDNKKLIIDDVKNLQDNIAEIQLVDNSSNES